MNRRILLGIAVVGLGLSACFFGGTTRKEDGADPTPIANERQAAKEKPKAIDTVKKLVDDAKKDPPKEPTVDKANAWQTVHANHEGLPFSVQIPPNWKWQEIKKGFIHQAVKHTGFEWTVFVQVSCKKLEAAEMKGSSEEAAKYELKRFLDNYRETDQVKHVAQQIIKVGNVDAAWYAKRVQPAGEPAPVDLVAHCILHTAVYEVDMVGERADARPGRTAKDFDDSLAEFLQVVQSFRVVGGGGDAPKGGRREEAGGRALRRSWRCL